MTKENLSVISTGRPEFDRKLGGGIPSGSLTLIEGQSDAGKSVLAQQLIWGSLQGGHRVILFTTENTTRSFSRQMQSLGLDVMEYLLLNWFRIYVLESTKTPSSNTFEIILSETDRRKDYDMIVVDSLTSVIVNNTHADVLSFFDECKRRCDKGRTFINVAHSYAFGAEILIRLRSVCDAHFSLHIEEVGDKRIKVEDLRIALGPHQITGNSLSFEVEPGLGMQIMPFGKAKV